MNRLLSSTASLLLALLLVAGGSSLSSAQPFSSEEQSSPPPPIEASATDTLPASVQPGTTEAAEQDAAAAEPLSVESTQAYYQVVFLQEDLASGTAGGRTYNYAQSTGRLEKLLKEGEAFTLSPEELAAAGVPLAFTGFSYERMGRPTLQDDGSYLVTMYYNRNSYNLRLHGWNWSRSDYTPIALGDDEHNVTRVFKYGESLMEFRQSDPLGKTWSLTRAPAGSGMTPTTQQQFTLPTVMPDPSEYRGDHAPFAPGQNAANTLDLWDFMSSFGTGAKERYENRVNVYLEKVPVLVDGLPREGESEADGEGADDASGTDGTGGGGADATNAYLPATPPFFDVTLMTGQQDTARNAYLEEARPGFTVNRTLTSGTWLAGPGATIYRPGNPPTWGNTSAGVNQPAQYLDIYYDRKTVSVDFYLDWGASATTISGKYEEPLFGEARADIAAIQLEANQRQQEFLGWYTSPDGFGGVRVDDAFLLGFLAVFPTEDLSLFAHWGSLPDPPDPPDTPDPPDPPDTPDPPDLPDPPDTPDPPDAPDPPDPPVAPTTPTIPETPSSPETPSEPGGPTSRTREAQGTSSALSSPSAPGPTESTPTAPQDEPQSPSEADRTSQHAAQVILDQMVPLSNLLPTATPFISLGQSPESWSVGNGALCLAGLAEAALVLATYLRRFRRGLASANKMVRLLRALVISLPILALIATGFSSSFAKPAVFFDTASPAIIMLFGIQQMVFFSLRQAEKATMAEGVRDKRFRMVERFEAKKDKSSFKVHKKS